MKKIFFHFIICQFIVLSGSSQSLTKKEVYDVQNILVKLLEKRDAKPKQDVSRKPELIIVFLETDSNGRVNNIHLLSDEKNKDSTFSILSNLIIDDFKEWRSTTCKGKIITIPLSSAGTGEYSRNSKYANTIFWDLFWDIQRPAKVLKEKNRVIITNPINYTPPGQDIIHPPTKGKPT
jgi:hypothetical protein